MTPWQQLNPRLHIAAAIGWAVFVVVTLAGLAAANLAAAEAERRARADAEALLAEFATQVRDALSMNLETRRSVLQATAAQLTAAADRSPARVGRTLAAVRSEFPEFLWLGTVGAAGRIELGTDGLLVGDDLADAPVFRQGRERPFVSDARVPWPAGARLPEQASGRAAQLLNIAVPFGALAGGAGGAVAACLSWGWVERVLARMQEAFNKRRQVELILAGRDGTVLVGPADWLGRRPAATGEFEEKGAYLVGTRAQLRLADMLGLGWTAVVRQRADIALAPVHTLRRSVFLIVFLAALLSAAAAMMVTRLLTRRLSLLAADAEAVRRGDHRALRPPPGADEVSHIGSTLAQLVDHLQSEKQALQTLNAELDERVLERTRRIERLADESRQAAVTRERLRIARDLHDTLAHSLMALLTQIRLVRKLRHRMGDAELDAELGRAEGVAATGLSDTRAALTQMRDSGVQDTGLGPALQVLAKRFAQRSGVVVDFGADDAPGHWAANWAGNWAGERAETAYRIVEEALRNVERHAQATRVTVRLHSAGAANTGLRLEVADDGVGFDPALPVPGHYGLRGMREQAALIDAQLQIDSRPGAGTRIVLLTAGP